MLALVYSAAFLRPFCERKGLGSGPWIPAGRGTEAFFASCPCETHAEFVEPEDLSVDWRHEREEAGLPRLDYITEEEKLVHGYSGVVLGAPQANL